MRISTKWNTWLTAYLMILPLIGLLTVFAVIPFLYAWYVSFSDWSFYDPWKFVGLKNYRQVLLDPKFTKSVIVGLKFSLYVVPASLILAFLFGHSMRHLRGKSADFVKTSIYIPTIMSGVIASIIFLFIYEYQGGFLNYAVGLLGGDKIAWLSNTKTVLIAIAVPAIWLGFGLTALIMLAGLLDIPESYYEAAELEGAGSFTKMFKITLPLMKNVILFLLVLGFNGSIQELVLPMVMTQGGPLEESQTPSLYIFNHFRDDILMGNTIASAILLFIVCGSVAAVLFRLVNSEKAAD
ncbi:carbohydrate ABC transporter permease [Paenibacillus montanisoli]|uniref:Sugar ABC transporter permease n=1 Tax=Paenibacillus montanisoli TaxID=2081970 RepID=A0A328TZS4_9BACL|nr:sugar ABC transporter permease [Paenibacillus montanisoli]RAP74095.1 sugar ABC transporter permease [Paenibacillus montanisoli]